MTTITHLDVGDDWVLTATTTDPLNADALVDPTTVVIKVTAPNGTTSIPTVTRVSLGIYRATTPLTQEGTWQAVITTTGTFVGVEEASIHADAI